jgi:putative nucleotidyltransferase with HDIG domain
MYQVRDDPQSTTDGSMTALVPRLLIVDDEAPVREFLQEALAPMCRDICVAADLRQAMRCSQAHNHDVLLADVCLPGCSGVQLLEMSQQLGWDCAVILMTGHAHIDQVVQGVKLEAADFLLKPFSLDTLGAAVIDAYRKLNRSRQNRREREVLSKGLRERTEELQIMRQSLRDSYRSSLETLVAALEVREHETYAHSFRVRSYALHLAALMNYPAEELQLLAYAAILHDIGKIAVPDAILLKPGPLTPKEFEKLKIHPVIGETIVRRMGFLNGAANIIRHHHERWDGRGYPDGLSQLQVPFGSRLFAVVDTIDAMTSHRCYRKALTLAETRAELLRCARTQFDPAIVEAAVAVSDQCWREWRLSADRDAQDAVIAEVRLEAALHGVPMPEPQSHVVAG